MLLAVTMTALGQKRIPDAEKACAELEARYQGSKAVELARRMVAEAKSRASSQR